MQFLRQHKVALLIFALALVVRLVYLGVSVHAEHGNLIETISGADGYYLVSQNLILGHGLSSDQQPPYTPYSFRPPLYHFFIAGSYFVLGGYWGVILLQIIVASLIPVLGYYLASFVVENKKIWTTVGVLLALEPSSVLYATFFYSETLFIFLFLLSLLVLFYYFKHSHRSYLYLSALLMGLATLTRPSTEYISLIVCGVLWWHERTHISKKLFLDMGAYVLLFLLILAPWMYRNHVVFGTAEISPQLGVNLYTVLLPTVYSIERGTTFQQEFKTLGDNGVLGPNLAPVSVGSAYVHTAVPLLLAHPKALAISLVNSGVNFFFQDGTFDFLRHIKIRPHEMLGKPATFALLTHPVTSAAYVARNVLSPVGLILLGRLTWIFITLMFFVGVWEYMRSYRASEPFLLSVSMVAYFALTSTITGFGLTSRYRLPVNGFILLFAVYGILFLYCKYMQKRIRTYLWKS